MLFAIPLIVGAAGWTLWPTTPPSSATAPPNPAPAVVSSATLASTREAAARAQYAAAVKGVLQVMASAPKNSDALADVANNEAQAVICLSEVYAQHAERIAMEIQAQLLAFPPERQAWQQFEAMSSGLVMELTGNACDALKAIQP